MDLICHLAIRRGAVSRHLDIAYGLSVSSSNVLKAAAQFTIRDPLGENSARSGHLLADANVRT
jgi:hypothetical protein